MVEGKKKYGFIDERGSYEFNFDEEKESIYFIVSCIIIDKEKVKEVSEKIEFIVNDFLKLEKLQDEELKWTMYEIALRNMEELEIEILSFIVNKKGIKEEYGVKDKESFLSFLNGILYSDIVAAYPQLNLISKDLAVKEFLSQFNKYLIEKHSPDLLGKYDVVFIEERDDTLSYLASFIGEILLGKYENKDKAKKYEKLYKIIYKKMIPTVPWPISAEDYIGNLKKYLREDFDENIAYNCIRIAFDFIRNNGGSKKEAKYAQVLSLKYLLSILLNYGENRYVFSEEIRNNLAKITGREFTAHYFQARIIAPLRDNGIIISTSKKGYKIPIKKSEIVSFIKQSSSVIKPMVERVKICRESVLKATDNEVDVLENTEFNYLKEIINIE